ncbi:DUF3267 domain-containing protein [Indiicoccus explosivorum]|uniref:DUF3267 domain-containing protein n=1 Tax=Indiicoccus explosivorum TaxID=1917864 RepID=UPI001F4EBEDE|nr:DUF3267 domain-containing protein [Indiicoccus explosivorum]
MKKQYGRDRIFLLSVLVGFGVFVMIYIPMAVLSPVPLSDSHFFTFLTALVALYPLHKLVHFLPLLRCRNCVQLKVTRHYGFLPEVKFRVQDPVNKAWFLAALLAPFVLINTALLALSIQLPEFGHYWALMLAFHSALCLVDLIYFRYALRSPKGALIEETETGYEILIPPVTL